jgi:hypothetical protein
MGIIRRKIHKATRTSKGKVIFSTILLLIVLGITGGIVYWQTHKKQIIRKKLEGAINDKSRGFYSIKYESLELNEITGYLSLTDVELMYDSSKIEGLRNIGITPPTLLNIRIPEISITGVETPKAIIDKQIDGQKLLIRNPVIEIIYTMQGKDSARNVPPKEIYEQLLGNLRQINVDTVDIIGATITTRNLKTKRRGIELTDVNLQLLDLRIDSSSQADPNRHMFSKHMTVKAGNVSWWSDDKLYRFVAKAVMVNSGNRTGAIGSFVMDPQMSEDAFVKSLPTQDDRFDFALRNISIQDLDINKLLDEEFVAGSVDVGSSSFKIYRDLNIKRDTKNRVGRYPHQVLDEVPIPFYIKKMTVRNSFVEYKERNDVTKNAGKVQFYDVFATLTNITNDKDRIAKDKTMNADIACNFLNKSPFKVSWVFYLGNSNGRFDVKGNLGSLNAKDLNPLTEPMGPARISEGNIKNVGFDFSGNDYSMNGSVKLLYEDLKVSLLEKDKGEDKWERKGITSLMANILIKDSNPRDDDEAPKVVSVTNQRDTNRSIFNLSWKTLFKGLQQSVGLKPKNPAPVASR